MGYISKKVAAYGQFVLVFLKGLSFIFFSSIDSRHHGSVVCSLNETKQPPTPSHYETGTDLGWMQAYMHSALADSFPFPPKKEKK